MITSKTQWQETTPMASHYLLNSVLGCRVLNFLIIVGFTFCPQKPSANQNSEGSVEWDQRSLKRREFNWLNSINPLSPNISTYKCSSLMHFLRKKLKELLKDQNFAFSFHFSSSHNLFSLLCIDVVGRKLMLVTPGT